MVKTIKVVNIFQFITEMPSTCMVWQFWEHTHVYATEWYYKLIVALLEIFWSDLTFKQQSSQIYRSAGTPAVLLLSTLVYSEVALGCLQSGKSGNYVA